MEVGDMSDSHYTVVRARIVERNLLVDKWESFVGDATEPPRALGTVTRRGWTEDKDGLWEHRERLGTIAECPKCGRDVECLADTDQWTEQKEGSRIWRHDGYGPDMGECCGLLLAETDPAGGFGVFEVPA